MADKRKTPEASDDARRSKRAAPTIDLTATEIKPPPDSDPIPPEAASAPQEPASASPHEAMAEVQAEMPPPPDETSRAESETPPQPRPSGASWSGASALAGGLVGGIVVALAAGALWYTGELPSSAPRPADLSADIAGLQQQIQELRNRPAAAPAPAAAIDKKTIDALAGRVATLESALANLPKSDAGVAQRLAAAENEMKSLGVALSALGKRGDDAAANAMQARRQAEQSEKAVADLRTSIQNVEKNAGSAVAPAALEAVQQRIAALEQSVKDARAELAMVTASEGTVRRALIANALHGAVIGGAPYARELAQAKALGSNEKTLAALASFASSGLPSATTLGQELHALIPAMAKASGAEATQGSFLERLQANATRLVRITPVAAPAGDNPSAVLARIDIAAAHGDIAGALTDLAKLPETARAPARGWIEKARARQAALAAANEFAANTARALSQPARAR